MNPRVLGPLIFACLFLPGSLVFAQVPEDTTQGVMGELLTVESIYQKRHALVIGISEYDDPFWDDLAGVSSDVEAVTKVLELHGYTVDSHMNLDRESLHEAYINFIETHGREEDTALLFYYAGHATTLPRNGKRQGFLIPSNGLDEDSDGFDFTALPMDSIAVLASSNKIRAKHSMFIFDACFSGSLFDALEDLPATADPLRSSNAVRSALDGNARIFITSGDDETKVPDRSIFRDWFVKILMGEGHSSLLDRDGILTGTKFFINLKDSVAEYSVTKQVPQRRFLDNYEDGDFIFDVAGAIRANTSKTLSEIAQSRLALQALPQKNYACIREEIDRANAEIQEGNTLLDNDNSTSFNPAVHTNANTYYISAAGRLERIVSGEACFRQAIAEVQDAIRESFSTRDASSFLARMQEKEASHSTTLNYLLEENFRFETSFDSSAWNAQEFQWDNYQPQTGFDWETFQTHIPLQIQFINRKSEPQELEWTYEVCASRDPSTDIWHVVDYRLKPFLSDSYGEFCSSPGGNPNE